MSKTVPVPGPRIAIVGVTGSGKTTTAARLSAILGIPHIELDAIHWQPGWAPMERESFRARVSEALSGPEWVTDGNYNKARDIIWGRASTLVWLDYRLPVILWQLLTRTMKRVISREELWNGNRETLRGAFFSRDSLFLWALQTYPRHHKVYTGLLATPDYAGLQVVRLYSRSETNRWLSQLEKIRPWNQNG